MLVDALRRRLSDPRAQSFQLMGEDLAALTGADLLDAAQAYTAALDRLSPSLRTRFVDAQTRLQREAHAFLNKYNRSVHTRIAGYLELGRRLGFAYPWPVVAVLGIEQVLTGIRQNRLYGLVGGLAERVGVRVLAHLVEGTEDVLRRTNRGIFADSAPTVLLAIEAVRLHRGGDPTLADALLDGPLPPLFDEECRALARSLAELVGRDDSEARFAELAALTRRHFAREQAIFTHHIGPTSRRSALVDRLTAVRAVPAPRVRSGRVVLEPYRLPPGFDIRDHASRVEHFGRAFVDSVTGSRTDYRVALAHTLARFSRR